MMRKEKPLWQIAPLHGKYVFGQISKNYYDDSDIVTPWTEDSTADEFIDFLVKYTHDRRQQGFFHHAALLRGKDLRGISGPLSGDRSALLVRAREKRASSGQGPETIPWVLRRQLRRCPWKNGLNQAIPSRFLSISPQAPNCKKSAFSCEKNVTLGKR